MDTQAADAPHSREPDDLATILFTSGTTGRPRGVMLSQRNLASNAAAMADAYGGGCDHTRLCILPFSHIYARTCDLYTWIYRGSRLVLAESRETLARDCQLVQPTVFNAVPYVYQRIADRVRASGAADEAAALAAAFGGRVEAALLRRGGARAGRRSVVRRARPADPRRLRPDRGVAGDLRVDAHRSPAGSVGRPLAGVEVRIADDGEVLVRGPNRHARLLAR